MQLKRSTKELVIPISRDNIVDQVVAFLYATKSIPADADVLGIKFKDINVNPVELTVFLKSEVDVIEF